MADQFSNKRNEDVYFAERIRRAGAKDVGSRGAPIFPEGKAKFKVAQPDVAAPDELSNYLKTALIKNRGAYQDSFLENIPGGSQKFVAEQRANYERDDPDGLKNRKRSPYSLSYKSDVQPDPLIDFDKREKPILVKEEVDKNQSTSGSTAYYAGGAADHVAGVSIKDIFFDNLRDGALDKTEYGKKPSSNKELSSSVPLHAYNGTGESIDDNSERNTLFHELAHSYTSDAEVEAQIYKQKNDGGIQDNLLKNGSYNTSTNAEYAQSVVTGLNSMRSISGHKLNDPQSVHQLFDEVEKNPEILNNISEEGGRLFRSYFHLKKNNPWAAEKLREATARDSKYLTDNQPKPPSLEEETMSMVRNYFSNQDNPSIV